MSFALLVCPPPVRVWGQRLGCFVRLAPGSAKPLSSQQNPFSVPRPLRQPPTTSPALVTEEGTRLRAGGTSPK